MQEWDRLALGAVGALVAIYPGYEGYKYIRAGKWGPALGLWIIGLAGIVVPIAEAMLFAE